MPWALPGTPSLSFIGHKRRKEVIKPCSTLVFRNCCWCCWSPFWWSGPKDLPKVARWLGRTVKKSRRLLNEIKKESGWDELEKEVRDVQHDVKDAVKQGDVSAELREAKKSVQDSAEKFDKDTKSN